MGEPCTEKHRITRLEADVRDLLETDKKHTEDITSLKEGHAESRLYQKLITEQLAEIKAILTALQKRTAEYSKPDGLNKEWISLFKWLITGTIGIIIAKIFTG